MTNNSTVVLIGKIAKPMTVKEVDVDGNKKSVGSMTVVVPKFAKNAETGKYERQAGTFYEVTSWSPRQQEFLTTLRKDEAVVVNGQVTAESYERKEGGKGIALHISDADVTAVSTSNNIGKQTMVAIGRVTRDFQVEKAGTEHTVARIPLAINNGDKTTYIDVEVWDKQVETMAKYLSKGALISANGNLELNTYTNKDGKPTTSLRMTNASVGFLEKRKDGAGNEQPAAKVKAESKSKAK